MMNGISVLNKQVVIYIAKFVGFILATLLIVKL